MQRWKLVSFDLDGTLITGTSSAEHLSNKMGDIERIRHNEDKYTRGEMTNVEFGDFDASRYAGYTRAQIYNYLEDVPLINHIPETISYFVSKGIPCVISTMAWDFIGEFIALKHGFGQWSGPSLEVDREGKFTGKIEKYFHESEKVSFIEDICKKNDLSMSEVIHIGDSRSDFPLFKEAGHSVALNAGQEARSRTHVHLASNSLLDVIDVIPNLD